MNLPQTAARTFHQFLRLLELWAAIILLPLITLIVTIDVSFRTSGSGAFSWSHEFLGFLMLVFFLAALPYCAQRNELIQVDLLSRFFPPLLKRGLSRLSNLLSVVIGGSLAWHSALTGLDMRAYNDGMVTLPLPLWPVLFIVSLLAAIWALGQFIQIFISEEIHETPVDYHA